MAALLATPFASCETGLSFPTENIDMVSVVRMDTNQTLWLGMSQEDAERVLGAPLDPESNHWFKMYKNGIKAGFRDGVLCGMHLYQDGDAPGAYALKNGGGACGGVAEDAVQTFEPDMVFDSNVWQALYENVDGAWKPIVPEHFFEIEGEADKNRYASVVIQPGDAGVQSIFVVELYYIRYLE